MKGRSALFFALMAIAIVAIAGTSNACVSAEDRYSVEVFLNKPGLYFMKLGNGFLTLNLRIRR